MKNNKKKKKLKKKRSRVMSNSEIYVEGLEMGWDKENFEDNFNHNPITDKEWEEIKDRIDWDIIYQHTKSWIMGIKGDDDYLTDKYDEMTNNVMNYLQSINDEVLEGGSNELKTRKMEMN